MFYSATNGRWKFILYILVGFAILISIGLGVRYYQTISLERETNRDFAMDVVKSLSEVYESRGLHDKSTDSESAYETAYSTKKHVENAENLMKKWNDDEDSLRGGIARDMLIAIEDLTVSADALVDFVDDPSDEKLAIFKINLESGREKFWLAAIGIAFREDNPIELSSVQKKEIADFVDTLFHNEIEAVEEQKRRGKEPLIPQEVLAAMMIRNGLYE